MRESVFLGTAVVLWILVLARVSSVWRGGPGRSLWVVFTAFASAITLELVPVQKIVNPRLAFVGGEPWAWTCCAIVAAVAARKLDQRSTGARSSNRELVAVTMGLSAVTVSFASAPDIQRHGASAQALHQAAYFAGTWQPIVHWAVWLMFLVQALAGMTRSTLLAAREADRLTPGKLATALRIGALGCRIGCGYVLVKVVVLLGWLTGHGWGLLTLDRVGDSIAILSVVVIATGATYDALTFKGRRLQEAVQQLVILRQLHPLWSLLYAAAPQQAASITVFSPRTRLSRRVIEIRDRQMALRAFVHTGAIGRARDAAHPAQGYDVDAVAEAALIEAARLTKDRGLGPFGTLPSTDPLTTRGGESLYDEARWLVQVARAHQHSPAVHAFAAEELAQALQPQNAEGNAA